MNAPAQSPLVAEPAATTPDAGPQHFAGPLTWFVFISCTLAAFGAALLFYQQDGVVWPLAALIGFVCIAIFAAVRLLVRRRCHETLPASRDVLTGALGFELHYTCRDVAATVFLHPDHVTPGHPTQVLCFVENYASRQRIACFRIGPHPELGLPAAHSVALHLAAGQAAVYILPLEVNRTLSPGAHDLPVTLCVQNPAGDGFRLPGTSRRLHDLWSVRFAAPFTLPQHGAEPDTVTPSLGAARYLSLAAVDSPTLHLEALESVLTRRP